MNQPGDLATITKTINVTQEMRVKFNNGSIASGNMKDEYYALTNLRPLPRTVTVDVKIRVKGLNNAMMPALAEIRNCAEGYFIGLDKNSTKPVTTQFTVNQRKYDEGSTTEGEISASIKTLGLLGNRDSKVDTELTGLYLNLWFQLVDKERTVVSYEWNIIDYLIINNNNNHISLQIDIEIPEQIPDVQPEGSEDSGFSSELIDWETEDVQIDL